MQAIKIYLCRNIYMKAYEKNSPETKWKLPAITLTFKQYAISVLKGNILGYYPIIFSVCCVNTHAMWGGLCFTKLQTEGISGVTEVIFLSIASII